MCKCGIVIMSVGLAILGVVNAITIDNHLISAKNDCYERLALGQKLDPRDIYRTLATSTATDCQRACSEEDQRCLSLSFGIDPKGNGTCELSYAPVRETADLRPIGTLQNPDFDLYIKKVDCKLNIPKDPPSSSTINVHKPTYAVAVLDSRPPGRPSSHGGYEVNEPHLEHARPLRPRPYKDEFVFHGPYQNYYDVPRPLPMPYGPDRDANIPRPLLSYSSDYSYYGISKPNKLQPSDDKYSYSDRLYSINIDRNRPFRPYMTSPDNPNIYEGRPIMDNLPYSPESNIRHPYMSAHDSRPNHFDLDYDRNRPYKPNYPMKRPYDIETNRRPIHNIPYVYEDDSQPYSSQLYNYPVDKPYRPVNSDYKPYVSIRDQFKSNNSNNYGNDKDWNKVRPSQQDQQQSFGSYDVKPSPGTNTGNDKVSVQSTSQGGTVTSIITQIVEPCYRRALAGKRIIRNFIRRAVPCERAEDCQRECQEEKRFVCEGFNYRLDETGRGQGDCELTDMPLSRMDLHRDVIPDQNYDFYEKDRSSGPDCRPFPRPFRPGGIPPSGHGSWHDYRPPQPPLPPPPHHRPALPPLPPPRPPRPPPPYYADRRKGTEIMRPGYHHYDHGYGHNYGDNYGYHYPRRPALPPLYHRDRYDTHYGGGSSWNRSNFIPYRIGVVGGPPDWGTYGGSYGGGYHQHDSSTYWGFDRYDRPDSHRVHYPLPPPRRPDFTGLRDHGRPGGDRHYPPLDYDSHRFHQGYNHVGMDYHHGAHNIHPIDDCSTRRGMGFRLHKGIVKKFFAVPNIHECEKLCYLEKDFICVSFSFSNMTDNDYDDNKFWTDTDQTFNWTVEERIINKPRYSITLSSPTDNCYLSDRPYKDLDLYTDLEPDRDFDIYAMHKSQSCLVPVVEQESECFLRVRSGERLDQSIVKDSMDVKTIVECQLECLTAKRFTCRSFSYRWGPPLSGGAIDNCQLSDWPFAELDPRRDLAPEHGYEVYERGSYGHGCEHDHFAIPGHHGHRPGLGPGQHIGDGTAVPKHTDKICYVEYAKPARLTSEAAIGALSVSSELDCKAECTRAREHSKLTCMSFSYRSIVSPGEPNCELSDIKQRDLLPDLDYRRDPNSWLFAWDNYNPQCSALLDHGHDGHDGHDVLDTWRVYSVNGWPCRRGTTCQENREAGFWSCELEGGEVGSWDYCCRPDHRCGYSQGYNYPWCYVGPTREQWRKCSDRYYPYLHYQQQQQQQKHQYHQSHRGGGSPWYSEKPYRPPYSRPAPGPAGLRPSLDEYEDKFQHQFLDPPRPGGFQGGARHWPVSYLHKETPPNANVSTTTMDDRKNRKMDKAISNVVQAIKAADLNNSQYQISNQSNSADDILFVRLPMPSADDKLGEKFEVVDTLGNKTSRSFDDLFLISPQRNVTTPKRELQSLLTMRRGIVTRTNRTARRRLLRPKNDLIYFLN